MERAVHDLVTYIYEQVVQMLAEKGFVGNYINGTHVRGLLPTSAIPDHASSHQNGGGDEVSVAGLSGELADQQKVKDHDHSGDAGDGAAFDAANLGCGAASDGQVLMADGSGGAAWEYAFTPLTTALTSTSWDGDAHSTEDWTGIDLSATFTGVPARIRAVLLAVQIKDSGSTGASPLIAFGPNAAAPAAATLSCANLPNDENAYGTFVIPCDANGDISYMITATGASTLDVSLWIWGYWL